MSRREELQPPPPLVVSADVARRLTRLFEVEADFVARTMRRLGVPRDDLEDAVHDVFLTTARKLVDVAPDPATERSFLFGVARRHAANVRRARLRDPDEITTSVASKEASIDELVDEHRAWAVLDAILDAMPFATRTVFVLFEQQGMTMQEIATSLQIPLGTVASRLKRGRTLFEEAVVRKNASLPTAATPHSPEEDHDS